MTAETLYDVFLSYNSRDREYVQRVADELKARQCVPFVDQWYLKPGHDWVDALERALHASRAVAVFLGPHEMGRWQQRERAWALDRLAEQDNFPVVPVLLPGCEPPLGFMKQLMWIDLRDDPNSATQLDALAAAIRGEQVDLAGRPQPQAMICPYRGLLAFREEDAEFFFGRDEYLQRLVGLVQRQTLVAVVGASGSGKSSLVSAGLVPELRKHGSGPVWDVVRMVPHVDPLYSLAKGLVPLIEPDLSGLGLERELNAVANDLEQEKPTTPLWGLANAVLRQQPGTERLLLFVDQWEELYTNCEQPQRRQRFIAELLQATGRKDSPLSIVLTVRGDFYGQILHDRPLLDRLQDAELKLGPMKRDELRSAIEGPAHNVGLTFQDGLVDRILREAGEEPGRLPLLEFALEELWKRREGAELTHAGYEDLGREPGQKDEDEPAVKTGCLSRAIATYAEAVYGELEPEERQALPSLFRKLVRAGSKSEEDTRRRASLGELDKTTQRVARKLADKRLLITTRSDAREPSSENEQQDPTVDQESDSVEVAHEELLRRWGRLQQWVNEDREFLLWSSRVDLKVEELQRDGNSALLSGRPLKESKKFYPARRADLDDKQRRFLDASLQASRRTKWLIRGSVSAAVVTLATIWFWLQANTLVDNLLATPPGMIEHYLDRLEPYALIATRNLHKAFQGDGPAFQRRRAAYGLIRLNSAGDKEVQFLLDSIPMLPKDEGGNLINALQRVHRRQGLDDELGQRIDEAGSDSDRRNRLLAVQLGLEMTDEAKETCKLQPDPLARTSFVHGFKEFPGDLKRIARLLETTQDPDLRSALCIATGILGIEAAEDIGPVLKRLYVEAPDGGTHGAADWALRQQGLDHEEVLKLLEAGPKAKDGWFVNGQGMTMVRIPAGTFRMGSKDDDPSAHGEEKPAHVVKLSKEFWLSDREVTVAQFLRFVKDTDYEGAKLIDWVGYDDAVSRTEQHPIQQVSWLDAVRYGNWLTAEENKSLSDDEKLTPYYDEETWEPVPGANGYRLPSEAEWEYACRAGSTTDYCFGGGEELLAQYAVYNRSATDVCASKLPNAWGLFGMHGNVYEWCADWYDENYYARSPKVDPPGPDSGSNRVFRGGCWDFSARYCRSAYRLRFSPADRFNYLGFRLALVPSSQPDKDKQQ